MKKLGNALRGLVLVMLLTIGMLGGSASAAIWSPINPADYLLGSGQWEYLSSLTLNSDLTMQAGSSLTVSGNVINNKILTMQGTLFATGSFFSDPANLVALGRVAPKPPPPPPGEDLLSHLETLGIDYLGAGIFADTQITIGSLKIDFGTYTPSDGDKFFVAATKQIGGISPHVTLTSNLDPAQFRISFIDPPFTIPGSQVTYEVAYVTVSAIPEPGTILLLGLGLLGLAGIGRKR